MLLCPMRSQNVDRVPPTYHITGNYQGNEISACVRYIPSWNEVGSTVRIYIIHYYYYFNKNVGPSLLIAERGQMLEVVPIRSGPQRRMIYLLKKTFRNMVKVQRPIIILRSCKSFNFGGKSKLSTSFHCKACISHMDCLQCICTSLILQLISYDNCSISARNLMELEVLFLQC